METASKVDIAVYALAVLRGESKMIHSEEIAAKCFELSPDHFTWVLPRYRGKWPDKYIVKTALEDAKKQAYGALVRGNYRLDISKDGWRLTPAGAAWFKENKGRVEMVLRIKGHKPCQLDSKRLRRRFQSEHCYKRFRDQGDLEGVTQYMFTDMLGCSPDAAAEVVRQRYDQLLASARLADDNDITQFLEACGEVFSELLLPD